MAGKASKKTPAGGKITTTIQRDIPPSADFDPDTGLPVTDPDDPGFEQEDDRTPLELALDELGGTGDSGQFTVFRLDPTKPNGRVFCGVLPPGLTDSATILTELQKLYGGGNYMLQIRTQGGTFSNRVIVSVDKREEPPAAPAQIMQESVASALKPVMETMQQMIVAQQRPAFNVQKFLSDVGPFLPMLLPLMQRMFAGNAGGDPLSQLDQLVSFRSKLKALGIGFEGEDGNGGPSVTDTLIKLWSEFGKPMVEQMRTAQAVGAGASSLPSLAAMGRQPLRPNPAMPAAPAPAGVPVPGASPAHPLNSIVPELRPFVPAIAQMAASGMVPEQAATTILDALPDEHIDALCDALENGTLVGALAALREFAGQRPWLDAVSGAILASVDDTGEPDVSGPDGGAADNVSLDT